MTEPDFLAKLHAQFEAPRAEVIRLAERGSRRVVHDLERLALGDENEVYRASLSDGAVVYVRIRRTGEGAFGPELWAMQQADSAGVPTPRLLAVEEIPSDTGPRSAMVIAESPGRQLGPLLTTLSEQERHRVMTNIGRTLALLHTCSTPGVDRPDRGGVWPDPHQMRTEFVAERIKQSSHLAAAGLTAAEAEAVINQIGMSPDTPTLTDPVLCHGDLHAGHVFVDDDLDVSGIIDWGLWHGGSAVDELGTMSMAYESVDFEAMMDAYGVDHQDPDLRRRLAVSVINQALGHIAWHHGIGNAGGMAHYVAAVREALSTIES